MTVYLIHFAEPYHHAQHYVGYTTDLPRRLREHVRGKKKASHLLAAVKQAGIAWRVTRVWPGAGRELEREIKRSHNSARYCPACSEKAGEVMDRTRLPNYALDAMKWVLPQPVDHPESMKKRDFSNQSLEN